MGDVLRVVLPVQKQGAFFFFDCHWCSFIRQIFINVCCSYLDPFHSLLRGMTTVRQPACELFQQDSEVIGTGMLCPLPDDVTQDCTLEAGIRVC
jgi:hypothetical protein